VLASDCVVPPVDGNAPIEQVAVVAVTVTESDAEKSWRHEGAIHSDDRERYRQAVIGSQPFKVTLWATSSNVAEVT
jgi:hypothetical protein